MKKTFGTICLFLMACLGMQAAQVDTLLVRSESMNKDIKVVTIRPDKAVKGEKCPVIYLLHGHGGQAKTWIDVRPDLPEIADRDGIIFVCPDGNRDSWYWDSPVVKESRYETFISKELIEYTDKNLNAIPDRSKRAITGLSMGGHGAVNLFLDHPENFRAAGSMSGVLDLQLTSLRDTELAEVIGDKKERIDAESAVTRVAEKAEQLKQMDKPIIVTCGYNDVYVCCTDVFSQKCRELDVPHIKILSPGKHSWPYWGFALEQHLWHFNKILKGDNLGY